MARKLLNDPRSVRRRARRRSRREDPVSLAIAANHKPPHQLVLLCEFDGAGIAMCCVPAEFDWEPIAPGSPPITPGRMPHRLVAVQLNMADGTKRLLR